MSETPTARYNRRQQQADVVSQHLPEGYSAEPDVVSNTEGGRSATSSPALLPSRGQESSLNLQGGDIHRELFRINARGRLPPRAATFSAPKSNKADDGFPDDEMSVREQQAPGGFRRQHLLKRQNTFDRVTRPVTRNFVDFLDLYGSFAGEDLAESDDETEVETEEEEEASREPERRPLLGRRKSTKRQAKAGDAGTTKSFFTLLKAFIGTGIMFLPKAFNNGGLLFSSIVLVSVAAISCICFRLLLKCRAQYGGGYGELGEQIGGKFLRGLILCSITISQFGFVCASLIFVAENLSSFLAAVTPGHSVPISANALIALQLLLLIPLSLIRNISKLGPAALLADVCIAVGLVYIWYYDIWSLSTYGMPESVQLFNPSYWTLTIGSAIFTFEGIGLLLPIQSSMKQPEKFGPLLYVIMGIITVVFASVGALSYATFGSETRTEIISNYPQDSKLVNAVQLIYSFAVLVGTPVQLFPAIRIIEGKIFGRHSGKRDNLTKWKKNALRTFIVLLSGLVSVVGASDLDKFVALIGSFACVPLVYIYPALLHYKGVARSRLVATGDVLMMTLGVAAMVYTTAITVVRWIAE